MTDGARPSKRILFRADGNDAIGSGHLQRCLTLAGRLRDWGCECRFICRVAPRSFNALVTEAGFTLIEIEAVSREQDAEATIAAIEGGAPYDALVVDHYQLDGGWERALRPFASSILVIDDLADREHYCDILLDPAPGDFSRYDRLAPSHCRKLLGPDYAMLRAEFAQHRKAEKTIADRVGRVLVSFGGVDPDNLSGITISMLRQIPPDASVDVVTTSLSPHRQSLIEAAANDPNLTVHGDARNMAELMAAADIAIGAGGSTSWERACLGLPSIVVAAADNQKATASALTDAGCALSVSAGPHFAEELMQAVRTLSSNGLRKLMSENAAQLVDGRGADRVARALLPPEIELREAEPADSRQVWEWRNSPEIRTTAIDPGEIAWESHETWFARQLADPQSIMLLGEDQGQGVGVVRFNIGDGIATVSIFLAPGHGGRGYGHRLLTAGQDRVAASRSDVDRFYADVRPENRASIALFEGAGYGPRLLSLERNAHDSE